MRIVMAEEVLQTFGDRKRFWEGGNRSGGGGD